MNYRGNSVSPTTNADAIFCGLVNLLTLQQQALSNNNQKNYELIADPTPTPNIEQEDFALNDDVPPLPRDADLLLFTPSNPIKAKATAKDVLTGVHDADSFSRISSIKYGSDEDFIFKSHWLGCTEEICNFWCLEIDCDNESVKHIGNFRCPNHRRKGTAVKRKLIES